MKVYVSALYSMSDQAQAAGNELEMAGYTVTSRWHQEDRLEGDMTLSERAVADLADVAEADCLMFLALPYGTAHIGGGRNVEFGYAFALGKRIVVIGERETIFCNLPQVKVYSTVGAAINFMNLDFPGAVDNDRQLFGGHLEE